MSPFNIKDQNVRRRPTSGDMKKIIGTLQEHAQVPRIWPEPLFSAFGTVSKLRVM